MQILYRVRQFWHVLTAIPEPEDLFQMRQILTTDLQQLFLRQQASEQAHSLKILYQLLDQRENHQDLLVAALIHDIGKTRHPLNACERVEVVLGQALFPKQVKAWGNEKHQGWRRAFVIAEQHSIWGAEMAAQAGASALTASIIRRHHDPLESDGSREVLNHPLSDEEQLILKLQALDNHY